MKSILGKAFLLFCVLLAVSYFVPSIWFPTDNKPEHLKNVQIIISIAWAGLGAVWMALSIYNYAQSHLKKTARQSFILEPKKFINRKDDIQLVLETLTSYKNISVYGQKGVGKSEFLKYVADILNKGRCFKHLSKSLKRQVTLLPNNTIYLDMNDSEKWSESIAHLSMIIGQQRVNNISELALLSEKQFGKSSLVIILDNVNNIASVQEVVRSISQYRGIRPHDVFIIGSITKLLDPHLDIYPIQIGPFSENHCKLFLNSKGINLSKENISSILQKSSGLPLYLNFLSLNHDVISQKNISSFSGYFISEIYEKMTDEDKKLLLFIATCNTVLTSISQLQLSLAPFSGVSATLCRLKELSTIIETNYSNSKQIKVHDLVRDICLENDRQQIPLNAKFAKEFLQKKSPLESLILSTLCSDYVPSEVEEVINGINNEIKQNNFVFLLSLWDVSEQWANNTSMLHRDKNLKEIVIYGYIISLLGVGSYTKAESLINSSHMYELRDKRVNKINTTFEFDLFYVIADLDHLLNRYELSRAQVIELMKCAHEMRWQEQIEKATWLCAHLTGHIGDDLCDAYRLYDDVISSARKLEHKLLELRSRNSQFALMFTVGDIASINPDEINSLISKAEDEKSPPLLSALWRNLSRYYRLKHSYELADESIKRSFEIAQDNSLRTIINCNYSYGENFRFRGNFEQAIKNYNSVVQQTEINRDMNLCTSAILCICICKILNSSPNSDKTLSEIESKIAYVESLSLELNMKITLARAKVIRYFYNQKLPFTVANIKQDIVHELTYLGLKRDLEIVNLGVEHLKYLEIHVH